MPRSRRVAPRGRSAGRRRVEWRGVVSNDVVGLAANSVVASDLNQQANIENLGSPTLVRTHTHIQIIVNGGTTLDDVLVAVGIGVVNGQAAGTAASLPSPITEVEFPWLAHRSRGFRFIDTFTQANEGAKFGVSAVWDFDWDSKAMRKLSSEEELVMVFETASGAGTASIIIMPFQVRFLFMQ